MEQLTLSIKFTAGPESKDRFREGLITLFNILKSEPNFINATIHEGIGKPEEFLVYETWNDTMDSFLKRQMGKTYMVEFESLLQELDVKREPSAYKPLASFGTHNL
ncbi:putative quinol monooxygenase [Dyadobacter sp. 3J3]|uniref:putative quinol monooxygenase n=1 Tax=Dyadobacter sp. 3J3 TaxID=2606600 RepID=UPI001359F857|nr:antibiotic biosynthesis monooxygenase [Dyadobacter sp. 3J3]